MYIQNYVKCVYFAAFVYSVTCEVRSKTCPSIENTLTFEVRCTYNGQEMENCTNPVEGTTAHFHCAPFYKDPSLDKNPNHTCHGGAWNYPHPNCQPVCGINSPAPHLITAFGELEKNTNELPWQAAIYTEKDKLLICGGTLISPRIILTAAHCVTDINGLILPKEDYVVAVGKYYRDYNDSRDKYVQTSKLHAVFVPTTYKGPSLNYYGDIAVLVTSTTFKLDFQVIPICVDWGANFDLPLNAHGFVAGWGLNSEGVPSKELREIEVPVIANKKCHEELLEDFQQYLTSDKICGKSSIKGNGLCRGDAGGGLTIKQNGYYFITGILSLLAQSSYPNICDGNEYIMYTNIKHYIDFINTSVAQFPPL